MRGKRKEIDLAVYWHPLLAQFLRHDYDFVFTTMMHLEALQEVLAMRNMKLEELDLNAEPSSMPLEKRGC